MYTVRDEQHAFSIDIQRPEVTPGSMAAAKCSITWNKFAVRAILRPDAGKHRRKTMSASWPLTASCPDDHIWKQTRNQTGAA
jgi:hypothetical protein